MKNFVETIVEYFAKGKRFLVRKVRWLAAVDGKEIWLGWQSCRTFQRMTITDRMVLMVEPNAFHAEILPGFVGYFNQLGYKTVLLCRKVNVESGVFCRVPENLRPIMLPMNPAAMRRCLKTEWTKRFEIFFLTSNIIGMTGGFWGLFFDYLGFNPKTGRGFLLVEHNYRFIEASILNRRFNPKHVFHLSGIVNENCYLQMLNPHYFGKVNVPRLNPERVVFISVGSQNRRFEELIAAVRFLENSGCHNFVVKVVGYNIGANVFEECSQRVEVLGCLTFSKMFNEVEKAHFFLPLLNPLNEQHKPYLQDVTSGARQLILGFFKVPIIHERFAEVYRFTKNQAELHSDSNLGKAMLNALQMDPEIYAQKVLALKNLGEKINSESLANLKLAISELPENN